MVKSIVNMAWRLQTKASTVTIWVSSLNTKDAIIVYYFSSKYGKQLSVSFRYS